MSTLSGADIQAINRPPQVASLEEFGDYEASYNMARYLQGKFSEHWKDGNRVVLKVATKQSDVTITGTVNDAVLHEQLRAAIKDQRVSGVRSVDISAVNVNYGLT